MGSLWGMRQQDTGPGGSDFPLEGLTGLLSTLRRLYRSGGSEAVLEYLRADSEGAVNWRGLREALDVRERHCAKLNATNRAGWREYWQGKELREIHRLLKEFAGDEQV